MIRAIIIDDEQHCINRLETLLNGHPQQVHVMGAFNTLEEGLQAVRRLKPELVFLDVELHDKTGFDLLQQLGEIDFEVIFTTAYDKYAVQAFRFSALDFLLKPLTEEDLQAALLKVQQRTLHHEKMERMETLLHNLRNTPDTAKRICVPVVNGLVVLQVSDIIRCQSDVNYTTIFLKDNQKLIVAKTLKEFEEMLTDLNFYRVHNSHLVNLAHVKSYQKGKGGFVIMNDHSTVEVSTRRKDDFLKRLSSHF